MRRRLILSLLAMLIIAPAAHADGDPASDVLVFKAFFLPYAPATPEEARARLDAATAAAARAGYEVRVAVIAGPGDLGVVPQFDGKPQDYAGLLGAELKFAYQGVLLTVMDDGYGLFGSVDPPVRAAVTALPKPASNEPADLVNAGADAVIAMATAAGKTLDLTLPPPAATATGPVHGAPAAATDDGGNTTAIALIAGGTVALLAALGVLLWVARRRPPVESTGDLLAEVAGEGGPAGAGQDPDGSERAVDDLDAAAGAVEGDLAEGRRDREEPAR